MTDHNLVRESDEYFCTRCGKRWDIHEDEPECIDTENNDDE